MPRRRRNGGGDASESLFSEPTGYAGITKTNRGTFEAVVRKRFPTLKAAREWRSKIVPERPCAQCGRDVPAPRTKYCTQECSDNAKREALRVWHEQNREHTAMTRFEKNILSDGNRYLVRVWSGGRRHSRAFDDPDEARAYRDALLARRDARQNRCRVCGKEISSKAFYCTRACNQKALKEGKLVRPASALPSTRRRAREMEKARIEARKIEILSGPGTFADAYRGVQEILREHVEKEKREAADSRDPRRTGRPADPREEPTCSTQTTSP